MCTVFVAIERSEEYPLILMSNRDEFLDRAADAMSWWKEPRILAGRDREAGGTWLAVDEDRNFSLVTNYRSPEHMQPKERSRGELPIRALKDEEIFRSLEKESDEYSGFNLLRYLNGQLEYAGNGRGYLYKQLAGGIHGLSNALINDPWPKVEKGKNWLNESLSEGNFSIEAAMEFLSDTHIAPDHKLPNTGIELEWERKLSALNIRTENYGTRVSTVLLQRADGTMEVRELNRVNGEERSFEL